MSSNNAPYRRHRHYRRAFFEGSERNVSPVSAVYADANYTTNLCPNPSFESDTAGWTATDAGTTVSQTEVNISAAGQIISGTPTALYGSQSLQVTTDGSMPGQGCIGPQGTVPVSSGPVIGSMTISLLGESGTLNVTALSNPGGIMMGNAQITLDGSGWQTVTFSNLLFPQASAGGKVYVAVTTVLAQDIQFNVDAVMYQPTSPLHPYIDGDQPGCTWTGTAGDSASYQQYQHSFSGLLSFSLAGGATFIEAGEIFPMPAPEVLGFRVTPQTLSALAPVSPYAALTDFGIWKSTDPDPAQTYGWWTNAGTLSGHNSYARIYGMVTPPLDYPVSGGQYAWRRAAYAAVGFQWASLPSGKVQVLTDVQLEYARTSVGSATTPSTYQRPRQLQVIIKPNRLNYCTNPAMQNGTANWSGINGNEVLTKDVTEYPGSIANYNNLPYSIGQSLRCKLVSSSSSGVQISVPFLIPGEEYIASFYCLPGMQFSDILGSLGTGSGDIADLINTADGYGKQPFGSGPYGGVNSSTVALPQTWVRCSFPLIASTDTGTLQISATLLSGANYPCYFWVTGVVIEPGDILMPYFDGNSGADALWETTGGTTAPAAGGGTTPGTGRSYYYNQLAYGQEIVTQTLAANTPLGISAATPLYGTPPTQ